MRGYPAVHLGVAEVKRNGRLIVRGGGRTRGGVRGGGWIPSSSRTGSLAGYPWSRWPTLSDSGDPRAWHHYPWMLRSASAVRPYLVTGAFVARSFGTAAFPSARSCCLFAFVYRMFLVCPSAIRATSVVDQWTRLKEVRENRDQCADSFLVTEWHLGEVGWARSWWLFQNSWSRCSASREKLWMTISTIVTSKTADYGEEEKLIASNLAVAVFA